MPPENLELLRDILREAEFLEEHSQKNDRERFLRDEVLKRAFVRRIEIIGEETKKVPDPLRLKLPGIEWRKMAGMRDRLIHDYGGVDYEIVWDVAITKAPGLVKAIQQFFESNNES